MSMDEFVRFCCGDPDCPNDCERESFGSRAEPSVVATAEVDAERELRREWWMNHGHPFAALYGDDGEMQCAMCPADFKRDPLPRLTAKVVESRLIAASRATSKGANDEASTTERSESK